MKTIKLTAVIFSTILSLAIQAEVFEAPLITKAVKVNLKSDAELKEVLRKVVPQNTAVSIFDQVGEAKITLQLVNDYNFKNPNSGPINERNDDLGYTHGFKVEIQKKLLNQGFDKYFLTISYETNLYTNSDRPKEFQENYYDTLYENEDGFLQADVYFKEENLITLMANKIKENNAFYWSAGGGFHEINADDTERGVLISGLTQQKAHHRNINNLLGGTLREYNYLAQEEASQNGIFLKGMIGKDLTVYKTNYNRGFLRTELEAMATQIEDASYLGTSIEFGNDFISGKNSILPDVRIASKYTAKQYKDSSTYREFSIEAGIQTRYLGLKLKYVLPQTENAKYLNPLPEDFVNREGLRPPTEPTFWLMIEGKLPQ
ncbi:MAG: hypothetical protein ACJAS4_003073 [Bacteriovoracaceae bacterium]|jgi:hypothetical protein